jgi:hypothetical protein
MNKEENQKGPSFYTDATSSLKKWKKFQKKFATLLDTQVKQTSPFIQLPQVYESR